MENKTIIKKCAIGLISLAVLVLIGFAIFHYLNKNNSSRNVNQQTDVKYDSTANDTQGNINEIQKNAPQSTIPDGAIEDSEKEIDELHYQLDAAEEELDMVNKQLADEKAKELELKKLSHEFQLKAANDPTYKKFARQNIDSDYELLFKELNLSPEQLEKLKDILVDKFIANMTTSSEMQAIEDPTEEKREEFQQRFDDLDKQRDDKINELLGQDDYETYQSWMERSDAIHVVQSFAESLDSNDKLNKDQEKELIEIIHREEEKLVSEMGYDPMKQYQFVSAYNLKIIEDTLKYEEKLHANSLENATGTLSTSQIDALNSYFKKLLEDSEEFYKTLREE